MRALKSERGSTLILLIGIIATLAIMSTSLVMLTNNVAHNTSQERTRAKAFDVAEAALDRGMYTLATNWLDTSAEYDTWVAGQRSAFYTGFRSDFPSGQFPNPKTGQFVSVDFVDDQSPIDYAVHYDKGQPGFPNTPNNKMYVIAQGATGEHASRVMAMVERTTFDMQLPRGVALFAQGNLLSNGGGNNPKITMEIPPNTGDPAIDGGTIKVGGFIDDLSVTAPGMNDIQGAAAGSINDVFPASLVAGLKATAQANGRYFTSEAAAAASPVHPEWSPGGGLSGLCVIEVPAGTTVSLSGTYNSEALPGILLVIGSGTSNVDFGGGGDFYGVVYAAGNVDKGHGNFCVHGMVVTAGTEDMRGTTDIKYNDNCIARLMTRFSMNVKLVSNTWRELQPQ